MDAAMNDPMADAGDGRISQTLPEIFNQIVGGMLEIRGVDRPDVRRRASILRGDKLRALNTNPLDLTAEYSIWRLADSKDGEFNCGGAAVDGQDERPIARRNCHATSPLQYN